MLTKHHIVVSVVQGFFNIHLLSYQFYYVQAQKVFAKSDDIKIQYYDLFQFFRTQIQNKKVSL